MSPLPEITEAEQVVVVRKPDGTVYYKKTKIIGFHGIKFF